MTDNRHDYVLSQLGTSTLRQYDAVARKEFKLLAEYERVIYGFRVLGITISLELFDNRRARSTSPDGDARDADQYGASCQTPVR